MMQKKFISPLTPCNQTFGKMKLMTPGERSSRTCQNLVCPGQFQIKGL